MKATSILLFAFAVASFLLIIFRDRISKSFHGYYKERLNRSREQAESIGFMGSFPDLDERMIRRTISIAAGINIFAAIVIWRVVN